MKQELNVTLNDDLVQITSTELGQVVLSATAIKLDQNTVSLKLVAGKVTQIETNNEEPTTTKAKTEDATSFVTITPPAEIHAIHLAEKLARLIEEAPFKAAFTAPERINIPTNLVKPLNEYVTTLLFVLAKFNVKIVPEKKKPFKAQHRWNKAVSEIEFNVDFGGSKAVVTWPKRTDMVIKAGATMAPEAPLNKDGKPGLSARMGEKIRAENEDKFKNFVTTEDIVLRSVNEVGLFLYFAGTNGWLVLKDASGKTIDEYTVVK